MFRGVRYPRSYAVRLSNKLMMQKISNKRTTREVFDKAPAMHKRYNITRKASVNVR